MSLTGLFASSTFFQGCKTWLQATERFIHYQFGDYSHGPYSMSAAVDETDSRGNSLAELAKHDELRDIAFFTTKGLLYGWSTYNFVTNNPNPIDVVVACAAIAETCGFQIKPKQRRAI